MKVTQVVSCGGQKDSFKRLHAIDHRLLEKLEAVAFISVGSRYASPAVGSLGPPNKTSSEPRSIVPVVLGALLDTVEHKWNVTGSTWAIVYGAVIQGESVMSWSVDVKSRIPTVHHSVLVRSKQTSVGFVPIPNIKDVASFAKTEICKAVLVVPTAICRVHDVELPVWINNGFRTFVDARAISLLPALSGLRDDVSRTAGRGGIFHATDVDILFRGVSFV